MSQVLVTTCLQVEKKLAFEFTYADSSRQHVQTPEAAHVSSGICKTGQDGASENVIFARLVKIWWSGESLLSLQQEINLKQKWVSCWILDL